MSKSEPISLTDKPPKIGDCSICYTASQELYFLCDCKSYGRCEECICRMYLSPYNTDDRCKICRAKYNYEVTIDYIFDYTGFFKVIWESLWYIFIGVLVIINFKFFMPLLNSLMASVYFARIYTIWECRFQQVNYKRMIWQYLVLILIRWTSDWYFIIWPTDSEVRLVLVFLVFIMSIIIQIIELKKYYDNPDLLYIEKSTMSF